MTYVYLSVEQGARYWLNFPEESLRVFEDTEESALYRKFLIQWKLRFKSSCSDCQEMEDEEEERMKNKVYNTKTKQYEAKK